MKKFSLRAGSTATAWSLLAAAVFTLVVVNSSAEEGVAYLVYEGEARGQIALDAEASPSEKFAAEELQRFIEACTQAKLPIVTLAEAGETPLIVVGGGALAASLGVTLTREDSGEQGYVMRTTGDHLVIVGSREAGTLYGVYDYLEQHLGVRWYAPGVTHTPALESLRAPQVDVQYQPVIQWRHTSYEWPGRDDAFQARVRDNSGGGGADHPFGVQHSHDGRCHSYFRFVSPDEFFETHPEYFSEIGGVRRRHETQLCLTNPEVLDIVTERMLQRMAEDPNARQHNFSQMDYYNYCQCPKCAAINEQYGTMGGTQYWFLNQLAERTSKVYPNKMIGTLAYMYTEEPPRDFEMHPNIAVWLCHMFPSCDSHSIDACPLNADYKRRAKAWSEIASHLYIWHYVVDFAHYYNPFPNFRALAADMRFYRDIGVEGIYLQGMGHGGGGGEFSLLRPWYIMKLAWNPDQDAEALLLDFLKGYYREAWRPIHDYITLLHDEVENNNIHMHLYTNAAQGYLSDAVLDKADALFDEAEALAGDDEALLEEVRVARMPLTYARCFPRNGYRLENNNLIFNEPLASMDAISAFVKRMETHGFKTIREIQGDPSQLMMLGMVFSLPLEAPSIRNKHLEVDVIPFLGGRALRIVDRATGECATGYNITRNLFFPFCGGEETRLGGMFDPSGMFFQFGVLEQSERSITLLADTGVWLIKRTITLDENEPIVVFSTEVSNLTEQPREAIVRTHANLDLGPLDSVRLRFTNRRGEAVERDMKPIIAGLREGEQYHDQAVPKGEWRLTGANGFELTQRFDDAQVDYAWLCAYPDYLNDLEAEVWAKPVILNKNESTLLRHEIEVRRAPK